MKTLLIMAGGTGGHIMPGLAVAEAVRTAGWRVVWLGNPEGMEAKLVPPRGFEMAWLNFSALRGKGLVRKLMLPFNLLRGFMQSWRLLGEVKPDVVLGLGGFISFPAGMMAVLRGIPLVVHEQNAIPGLANKVLARLADRVLTGFPGALAKAEWCGNPVRADIGHVPSPVDRYPGRSGPLHLLVVGGSLGAEALNRAVPQALAQWPAERRPEVVHQAGAKHIDALNQLYADAGVESHAVAFIEDMAGAYAWADLVICRAGALTIAELAAAGAPSVLVPFPHAVDDHQTVNARFLTEAGAAILLPQQEMSVEKLLLAFAMERGQLQQMAERARSLARIDAAEVVAARCVELAK